MRSLLKEMNRVREAQGRELRPEQAADFETRYDKILDLADQEYQDNPPSTYYRKGYNLSPKQQSGAGMQEAEAAPGSLGDVQGRDKP